MKIRKRERFKTVLLFTLVMGCFFQVGILWLFQNHGLPISFFQSFFSDSIKQKRIEIGSFFVPYRIVASEGFDEAHYVLNTEDKEYQLLWSEALLYLKDLFIGSKPESVSAYNLEEWSKIAGTKSFVFEFRALFSMDLLRGLLNVNASANQEPKGIVRMVILPDEDINNNLTVSIYDGRSLFKYKLKPHENGMGRKEYEDVLTLLKEKNTSTKFGILKEIFPVSEKAPFQVRPDVPVAVGDTNVLKFSELTTHKPAFLSSETRDWNKNATLAARMVLGNDKDSYDLVVDPQNTIILRNVNHIYRMYEDGWMEYRYLSEEHNDENGTELSAFEKAVDFISSKKVFLKDPEIVFLGTQRNSDSKEYTFTFGYAYNGVQVVLPSNENRYKQDKAIIIRANGNRVVEAKWLLSTIEPVKSDSDEFRIEFTENVAGLFEKYKALEKKSFSIEDSFFVYAMNSYSYGEFLQPSWMVITKEGKTYDVPLLKK